MLLHEKTLELNITHELLNLADSWYWFLTDIPLWRYWRPRYRLPFLNYPKSTAAGFHINTEGKDDPTGEVGGGFDVRIKSGLGGHLLFLQYKLGEFQNTCPDPKSIFNVQPFEHYKFEINNTKTNQHFLLRNLSNGVGKEKGNAVVYALPLIQDMDELERYIGKLVRRTKFISIDDIDKQAALNGVSVTRNQEHLFRVGDTDMNRCEINFFFIEFKGQDRTAELIADIISIRFRKILVYFDTEIYKNYKKYNLNPTYIPQGIQRAFGQYIRYLAHYFEVDPVKIKSPIIAKYVYGFNDENLYNEFVEYISSRRDILILSKIIDSLSIFTDFIDHPIKNLNEDYPIKNIERSEIVFNDIPEYNPSLFIPLTSNGINIPLNEELSRDDISKIMYLLV